MKPAQYPDLKTLIDRLDKRNKERQAARVIIAGSILLGAIALVSPFLVQKSAPVAVLPEEVAVPVVDTYQGISLEGKAAIVYDLTTKEVLFSKNDKAQLPLASLTKLLTAYAGATSLDKDASVVITPSALAAEGESGLSEGEVFTFTDAARLALVASSNDAAEAIAEAAAQKNAVSGRSLLASAAAAIGLPQTYAVNGTGLDVSTTLSGGYGSAYDVAQLAGALLSVAPELALATTLPEVSVRSNTGAVHTLPNTNQDVVHVPNMLLSKTGFTDLAGGNLAIVFDSGIGHPVAIVVLGSSHEGRFNDVNELLTRTRNHFANLAP
ncbi:MAG: hypothetical protein AAB737_02140 [Patescibacteria group bacterium]